MKSKTRNIILITIAVVLLIVVILCSTIFTIKDIKVNFLDTNHTLSEIEVVDDVVESGAVVKGKSMFLINKSKMTEAIESSVPYLRVIGLEAVFPDVLRINCVERKDCFSVKVGNSTYAILDKYYKVLNITNATALTSINISDTNLEVGEFVTGEDITYYNLLVEAFDAVGTYENAINTSFMSIELVTANERTDFVMKTREGNITINIQNVDVSLKEKINKIIAVLGQIANNAVVNVYMHNNEVIVEEN